MALPWAFIVTPFTYCINGLHLCEAGVHEHFRGRDAGAVVQCEKHHSLRDLVAKGAAFKMFSWRVCWPLRISVPPLREFRDRPVATYVLQVGS